MLYTPIIILNPSQNTRWREFEMVVDYTPAARRPPRKALCSTHITLPASWPCAMPGRSGRLLLLLVRAPHARTRHCHWFGLGLRPVVWRRPGCLLLADTCRMFRSRSPALVLRRRSTGQSKAWQQALWCSCQPAALSGCSSCTSRQPHSRSLQMRCLPAGAALQTKHRLLEMRRARC